MGSLNDAVAVEKNYKTFNGDIDVIIDGRKVGTLSLWKNQVNEATYKAENLVNAIESGKVSFEVRVAKDESDLMEI